MDVRERIIAVAQVSRAAPRRARERRSVGRERDEGCAGRTGPSLAPNARAHDLRELAGKWNKDGREGKDLKYDVKVLDMLDVTASAKLTAKWGIDYMHLTKVDGSWKIVQIVWQSTPKEG